MDDIQTVKPANHKEGGQALVEYALIAAFVIIVFAVTLAATGPAIGNVFSNVVYGLIGQAPGDPVAHLGTPGGATAFWATVTWVYQNPQGETPYPTPLNLPTRATATNFVAPSASPPGTDTLTPSQTASKTPTSTPTDTLAPTTGPSATPEDKEHLVPFADRADMELDWRLDRSFALNPGGWTGNYYNSPASCGDSGGVPASENWINVDWGGGSPDGSINVDNFIACWRNAFNLSQDTTLTFTATNLDNGTLTVVLDGSTNILNTGTEGTSANQTITAGNHTLDITYTHSTGAAAVTLDIERPSQNPSDSIPAGVDGCPWATTADDTLSGSPMNVFDDDPNTNTWPNGQTCYLELRGWINSASAVNPKLSFWDVWDFSAASGITAQLQIANYDAIAGNPNIQDRSATWNDATTINLRDPGTANYNWSRREIDLSTIGGLGTKWTFRFVLSNTSGSAQPLRWYIDDVQVLSDPTPNRVFTVRDQWDLNARAQMADFIFNADANFTLEQTTASPPSSEWRWNIASDFARSGTAWVLKDYAPSAAPGSMGNDSDRIYYVEFRYPIDLTVAPSSDFEGDTGNPMLTFWHAYAGSAPFQVQYSNSTSGGWQPLPFLMPLGAPPITIAQPNAVDLSAIPNVDTEAFRLRFALTLDQGVTPNPSDGWFIDDIAIERDLDSPYVQYPFIDSAEDTAFTAGNWTTEDDWAATTQGGGVLGSGHNYTDSPGSGVNYVVGEETFFEMRRMIDLRADTSGNPELPYTAATAPMLTFWMRRDLEGTFDVELWTPQSDNWTTAWTTSNLSGYNRNNAWERVEIDLREAIRVNNGIDWSTVISNGIDFDDDIKIRFRLAGSVSAHDGVYVDQIEIKDAAPLILDISDSGDGIYSDSIDANSEGLAFPDGWYLGGNWNWISDSAHLYQGTLALADSPLLPYQANWTAIAEMAPIFDLANTDVNEIPSLDFFTRYHLADGDNFSVEIAVEQPGDAGPQRYNDMFGWSAWTPVTMSPIGSNQLTDDRVDTMHRWRVDLRPYATANNRIRIRFVLTTNGDSTLADGVTLDALKVTYGVLSTATFPDPNWTNLSNWILEGNGSTQWNATSEFVSGGTTGAELSAPLGLPAGWHGLYFDCEILDPTPNVCNNPNTYTALMDNFAYDPFDTVTVWPGVARSTSNPTPDLNLWINDGDLPPGVGGGEYVDTFAGRWTRNVQLTANTTYQFYAISNEAFRLMIDNESGIVQDLPTVGGRHYIIDAWYSHSNQLHAMTIQVQGATLDRVLTAEFYDTGGNSVVSLTSVADRISLSDSPNAQNPTGYTDVLSSRYGNSSLTYSRFIDTSGGAKTLSYSRLWNLRPNSSFYVEYSTNGGFTWTIAGSETITGTSNEPPFGNWDPRSVTLPVSGTPVTFRFRLDTRGEADSLTGDGIWLADIVVS